MGQLPDRCARSENVEQPAYRVVLTHDGSRTLQLSGSEVTFRSTSGAATESRHVFVNHCGIAEPDESNRPIRILEIGFGTGLNFLLTADEALRRERSIDYLAVDRILVPSTVFRELGYRGLVENGSLVSTLQELHDKANSADAEQGKSIDSFQIDLASSTRSSVNLRLYLCDFRKMQWPTEPFDVVYFDPFGPESNEEIWQADFLATMYPLLRPGGKLLSYCVKSDVQRCLRSAGFDVKAVRGPTGGKRQVLVATRNV